MRQKFQIELTNIQFEGFKGESLRITVDVEASEGIVMAILPVWKQMAEHLMKLMDEAASE